MRQEKGRRSSRSKETASQNAGSGTAKGTTTKRPAKSTASKGKATAQAIQANSTTAPAAGTNNGYAVERESGPRGWLFPILESAYSRLEPRELAEAEISAEVSGSLASAAPSGDVESFTSTLQPGRGESVLAAVPQDLRLNRLAEYKRRKSTRAGEVAALAAMAPGGPSIPGQINWAPLGPSVVLEGQARGLPPVAGRIAGIAVASDGLHVYAASANGGVFSSDDGGMSWRSLMDAFDTDPTNFASTSLVCGAIAIDLNDLNRTYVGTGEGDTYTLFDWRITNALPAYRGIGPIRSDDGGVTWIREPSTSGSPDLAGKAFFALAVDPANRESVVGATTEGLYQRIMTAGNPTWTRRRTGVHSSVVATRASNVTHFYAAEWGQGVFHSTDGANWSPLGTSFPTANVGRIALGIQPDNPDLLYAMVANVKGALLGVFRYEDAGGVWKRISSPPPVLPTDQNNNSQGDYDLAIAVDPEDADIIYLGGSYFNDPQFWPASIWRCQVQVSGSGFRMTGSSIGPHAHADVHILTHTPRNPNALWVGCDGGVFLNRDPRGAGIFDSRNNGLACLCPNFFEQHPTDPSILFCGLQDNGTARTAGGAVWKHVNGGDGGYCLINWANFDQVLVFANGSIYRATDGGVSHNSWTRQDFAWLAMTEPIVGPPYNPTRPAEAKLVGLGAGKTVHLSKDFGDTWLDTDTVTLPIPTSRPSIIFAMVFASPKRFFAGTTTGEVFQVDKSGSAWKVKRLDNVTTGALALSGIITDIAIDWADTTLSSVYIAFGGSGDYRHVWHFDGTQWEARSGAPGAGADNLLDVEHNALVIDRQDPDNVYVGANIGVWHSPDRGQNWFPLPNGLPDAPVFDLQIHPSRRLLRATTHGRGLYEYPL